MTHTTQKTYRYRVSKKLFKLYNQQNNDMLNGISRLIALFPFSTSFHQIELPYRNKNQALTEQYLKNQIIPKELVYFRHNQTHPQLSDALVVQPEDIHFTLNACSSHEITTYLELQFSHALRLLSDENHPNIDHLFKLQIENTVWKITDHLMFMNHDWNITFQMYKCEITSPYYVLNLLFLPLAHRDICLSFQYPKDRTLLENTELLQRVAIF